jgi:3-mercaptopyruvate sulfurtransferase SseA
MQREHEAPGSEWHWVCVADTVHPKRIAWFVTRDVIYPPPTPEQAAAATTRDELVAAIQQVAIVVDARKPDEFKKGRITGAINIPAEDPNSSMDGLYERALRQCLRKSLELYQRADTTAPIE